MANISIPYSLDDDAPVPAAETMPRLLDNIVGFFRIWRSFDTTGSDKVPKAIFEKIFNDKSVLCEIVGEHNGFPFRLWYDDCHLYLDINAFEWIDFRYSIIVCQTLYFSRKEADSNKSDDDRGVGVGLN